VCVCVSTWGGTPLVVVSSCRSAVMNYWWVHSKVFYLILSWAQVKVFYVVRYLVILSVVFVNALCCWFLVTLRFVSLHEILVHLSIVGRLFPALVLSLSITIPWFIAVARSEYQLMFVDLFTCPCRFWRCFSLERPSVVHCTTLL